MHVTCYPVWRCTAQRHDTPNGSHMSAERQGLANALAPKAVRIKHRAAKAAEKLKASST